MLGHNLTLKCNELCLIGNRASQSNQSGSGLYARDTRFLSDLSLDLGDDSPVELLSLEELSAATARLTFTNMVPISDMQPHQLLVEVMLTLTTGLEVNLAIQNYSGSAIALTPCVGIDADFRDMFDVRGMPPVETLTLQAPEMSAIGATLGAIASDGSMLHTRLHWDAGHAPTVAPSGTGLSVCWPITLAAGDRFVTSLRIEPMPHGQPLAAPPANDPQHLFTVGPRFATGDPDLDRFLNKCDNDLATLQTSFPEGVIAAAGIPWFIAPFGRDSLITALQTMHRYPHRAQSTLRVLAQLQGEKIDPFREEQPGKIAHEMRYGEMARTGQIPHTPYYGSIDSTPLFVMTLAACDAVLPDVAFFTELLPHAERAFTWIEQYGDMDGDGLIEFAGLSPDATHISQQGWKDSFDSLHFADGREVTGPIALIEPQAYVYAAYAGFADACDRHGLDATPYRTKAEALRQTIEDTFWLEDAGFYAQALDGTKQPVDAISSNAGHLLFCGVPGPERAALVARRLAEPDMNSGWGIRTLSTRMATYNPMSYHNGSVWPHDVSLIMAGLYRYGHTEFARELARQLIHLASFDPCNRLAELYCGFADDGHAPVPYPVSCSPQAWAAGAGMLIAQVLEVR